MMKFIDLMIMKKTYARYKNNVLVYVRQNIF